MENEHKGIHNKALRMVKDHPELRLGQAVMNVLHKYYPDIYNKITDTECERYYEGTSHDNFDLNPS